MQFIHPAVVDAECLHERRISQSRRSERLIEHVAAHAPRQRQNHRRHRSGEKRLPVFPSGIRALDIFKSDPFEFLRSPLFRRRFHPVFPEGVHVAEQRRCGEVARVGILAAVVHQQIARRTIIMARVKTVFPGEFRNVLQHPHRREQLHRHMVNQVSGHSGDRLNQRTLIVCCFQADFENRFSVLIDPPGFLHPLVKRGNLFHAVRRETGGPYDCRAALRFRTRHLSNDCRHDQERDNDYKQVPHRSLLHFSA